jgi:hypothetical protein
MPGLEDVEERLLRVTEGLIRFRFRLPGDALDLASFEENHADEISDAEIELRAHLEHSFVEHFDPLLRVLLDASGNPRAKVLAEVLELVGVQYRLQTIADHLPRSPREDEMIEGMIPPDSPTEMRTIIGAVNEDQLDLAINNLLHAAGYKPPGEG